MPASADERPDITEITIAEIVENVESVPPFQRDAIHQHYVGMRVRWSGKLSSVSRIGAELMQVSVHFLEGNTLGFCSASPASVKGIVHAAEGTLVEVTGTIKDVMKYEVALEDCEVKPSAPAVPPIYAATLRRSPREAILTAWQDVERTALNLLDAKVTRPDRSLPIPVGMVGKTLQLRGALNLRYFEMLDQLAQIKDKVVAEPNADREAQTAGAYCTLAAELIDYMKSQ